LRAATGKRPSTTAGTATSRRTWTARSESRSGERRRRIARQQGRSACSLPLVLLSWMVIYPIIAAVVTTICFRRRAAMRCRCRPTRSSSRTATACQPAVTLWTTAMSAVFLPSSAADRAHLRFSPAVTCRPRPGPGDLSAFVPSIILSYAFIRSRPQRHVDPAQRRPSAEDPLAHSPGDR
jgi:hypothetical protein